MYVIYIYKEEKKNILDSETLVGKSELNKPKSCRSHSKFLSKSTRVWIIVIKLKIQKAFIYKTKYY